MKLYKFLFFILFFFCSFLLFPNRVNATFIKQTTGPVISRVLNTWENQVTEAPNVFIDNNIVKMFYSGADYFSTEGKFQIGIATSIDGIHFTKDETNPIIKWDFIDTTNVGIQHPNILVQTINGNKLYKLWFNNIDSSIDFFELYYSTSNDSHNWSSPTKINFNTLPSAWEQYGRVDPNVMFDEDLNIYRMWYSGRNSGGQWSIGYATSNDGINWDKRKDPILTAEFAWEGEGINNVSVIKENNLLHIFYHGNTDIGYATSSDGILWTKNLDPVLSPDKSDEAAFDYIRVVNPFILKYNNEYYLYYDGLDQNGNWQIGLAKSSTLPGESNPSVPPTNTPTYTPTPTIGPPPFYPIIIIPGLGGSWNQYDIFSCNPSTSGLWTATPFVDVYDRLMDTLVKKAGLVKNKDFYFYTYDWRQTLPAQSARLKTFISQVLAGRPETKVRLVGHSLGGLVIRAYLTDNWLDNKAASAITIGSPHQGTATAYPLWEAGEMPKDFSVFNIALNQILQYCRMRSFPIKIKSQRQVIQELVPVTKNLLPTFDYLYKNNSIIHVENMVSQNDWLNTYPFPVQHFFIPFQTLTGSGFKTILSYSIKNPAQKEKNAGDWIDGKVVSKKTTMIGDGTILLRSASLSGILNETIAKNHVELISSKEGVAKILKFLNISVEPLEMSISESTNKKGISVSIDKPVSFNLLGPQKNIESQKQFLILSNPSFGKYSIKIRGEKNEEAKIIISLFKDGEDIKNIDYTVQLKKGKTNELFFNYSNDSSFASEVTVLK